MNELRTLADLSDIEVCVDTSTSTMVIPQSDDSLKVSKDKLSQYYPWLTRHGAGGNSQPITFRKRASWGSPLISMSCHRMETDSV